MGQMTQSAVSKHWRKRFVLADDSKREWLIEGSTKIDSRIKLAHLVVHRMFWSMVWFVRMGCRPIGQMCSDCLGIY